MQFAHPPLAAGLMLARSSTCDPLGNCALTLFSADMPKNPVRMHTALTTVVGCPSSELPPTVASPAAVQAAADDAPAGAAAAVAAAQPSAAPAAHGVLEGRTGALMSMCIMHMLPPRLPITLLSLQ